MARIRTIKPEFPQSESMGRVSRDARLLFIQLWTICDDEGRTRGNSRMLASLLFPYDDDAPSHIDEWIGELEREECVARYIVDGSTYLQICNWLTHQKIDKPSPSKIPPFDESSRILANPRGRTKDLDQGSRTKDLKPSGADAPPSKPPVKVAGDSSEEAPPSSAWSAYTLAYQNRYTVAPVRNAKVNSQLKHLQARLGSDAPAVAAFYLTCDKPAYLSSSHCVDLLLRDAEGLRTEWATGKRAVPRASSTAEFMRQLQTPTVEAIDGYAKRVG